MRSDGSRAAAGREAAWEAAAARAWTPCDDGRLAWRRWGSPQPGRAALVLVPGGFGSWRHWARNVETLSAGRAVWCVELPGLGDSDPMRREHTAENIARIVIDGLAETVGPAAAFHLAGFSFGGIIAGHVAAELGRACVRSLAVVGSNGLGLTITRLPMRRASSTMSPEALRACHRENLATLMISRPERVDDLAVHLQLETTRRARSRSGEIPRSDTLARALRRVRSPVHGIWGEHDALARGHLDERRALFAALEPPATFTVIADAGHWVMYEQPARFDAALLAGVAAAEDSGVDEAIGR